MLIALLTALLSLPGSETTVGFVGDVSFAGRADQPIDVFADVRARLAAPSFTVANAEGLLLEWPAPSYRESRLDISAPTRWAAAWQGSGVDLLGTANNHAWDAGAEGVRANLTALADKGQRTWGSAVAGSASADAAADAYRPFRLQSPAGCLSFVPATLKSNRAAEPGAAVAVYGPKGRATDELLALVTAERAAGCAPIVSIHWGTEGRERPDAEVVKLGRALADAGAALVVGHHPHVLQGFEWRGATPIAWSLGNFVFSNREPKKRWTGMLVATFTEGRVAALAFEPMTIDPRTFRPVPSDARAAAKRLAALSSARVTVDAGDGKRLLIAPVADR